MSPTPSLPPRPEAEAASGKKAACFAVHAAADPSVMPRVLGVFAKRGLIPSQWHSVIASSGASPAAAAPYGGRQQELYIDIQAAGMDRKSSVRLAEDLRKVVGVKIVLTSQKQYALTA